MGDRGAPLESGDGWRVWYSWPAGPFTPATPARPHHRRAAQAGRRGPVGSPPPPRAAPSARWRARAAHRRRDARRAVRGHDPRARPAAALAHAPEPSCREVSLLIGSCFWINDDRDGFYASAVQELVQRERPAFKVLMGDQLYADVWAPLPLRPAQGPRGQVRALLGRRRLPGAARRLPDARQLRRPRVLERLPRAADPGPVLVGPLRARQRRRAARALRRLPGGAEPGRQALEPARRRAGLVLHRRHPLAPHRATAIRTPSLMLEEQWLDLEPWAKELNGPACSCSRSRC